MARHKDTDRENIQSDTRQRLLEAAADEFAREGYVGANINLISTAAGFAKGTIYNYFPSKRALMHAIIDEFSSLHLEFMTDQVLSAQAPEIRLKQFFKAGLAFVADHLSPGRVIINCLYGPDAEFKEHLRRAYLPMFQLISQEIIMPGIDQGIFRAVNPNAMAGYLMTIYLGIASTTDEVGRSTLDSGLLFDYAFDGLQNMNR
jgi:AcrR family transcriptional regulator